MANVDGTPTTDTSNKYIVAARSGRGLLMFAPPVPGALIDDADALNLAAWLVALVPDGPERFKDVLRAVLNT